MKHILTLSLLVALVPGLQAQQPSSELIAFTTVSAPALFASERLVTGAPLRENPVIPRALIIQETVLKTAPAQALPVLEDPCVQVLEQVEATPMPAMEALPLESRGYSLYRSPEKGKVGLLVESILTGRFTLRLKGKDGRLLREQSYLSSRDNANFFELDLSGFGTGAFSLDLLCDGRVLGTERVFVVR